MVYIILVVLAFFGVVIILCIFSSGNYESAMSEAEYHAFLTGMHDGELGNSTSPSGLRMQAEKDAYSRGYGFGERERNEKK